MHFAVLGSLQVTSDDGEPIVVASRNLRIVLATLLCRPNVAVPTTDLIDALWGSQAPRTARKTTQVYVYQLRKLLGDERIMSHPHGYAITLDVGELDAKVFQILAREAGRDKLAEAEKLWRGDAFADLAGVPVLAAKAAELAGQRFTAWMRRVDIDIDASRHEPVVAELLEAVRLYPLDERVRARLMTALYRCGRRADALKAYQECRDILAEELGVEPSGELQQIQLAILRGETAAAAPTADSTAPNLLPPPVRGFVGRAEHLSSLDALLDQSTMDGATLVLSAIAGMGGVGKTDTGL